MILFLLIHTEITIWQPTVYQKVESFINKVKPLFSKTVLLNEKHGKTIYNTCKHNIVKSNLNEVYKKLLIINKAGKEDQNEGNLLKE